MSVIKSERAENERKTVGGGARVGLGWACESCSFRVDENLGAAKELLRICHGL